MGGFRKRMEEKVIGVFKMFLIIATEFPQGRRRIIRNRKHSAKKIRNKKRWDIWFLKKRLQPHVSDIYYIIRRERHLTAEI